MKNYIYNGHLVNRTELAMCIAYGKVVNPYRCGDLDNYYSVLLALNEMEN